MYEAVFSPVAVGPLALEHRVVMGSMHLGLEGLGDDGRALAAFYAARAAAGAGLIVTGGSAVSRVGAAGRGYSFVNEDGSASALARVADAVHAAGGRILLQLFHAGRYGDQHAFDLQPVAPSAVYSSLARCEPRALTDGEVRATIDDFAAGAARARELGYDGVEIMGSEGYLLNQFTAPLTNLRGDEWGGDSERRLAFPLAVAAAVRAGFGAQGAVVYRISGADLVEGGTPDEDVMELAARLADGIVDAVNVGIGWHEARVPTVQLLVPHGAWLPWARAVREAVGGAVPVIASNRITSVRQADAAVAEGSADLVSLARPFLADAEVVAKARDQALGTVGAVRATNVCIGCDQACIDRSLFDQRVSCVVNPRAGFELELGSPAGLPGLAGARIAVVGGGPAGMEAARSLALAGAQVDLFERGSRLGGQFRMACQVPGKQDYAGTIAYYEDALARLGVTVLLGVEVLDEHFLAGARAVVIATGVVPRPVHIPGALDDHVITYQRLLDPEAAPVELGDRIAIIGAGGIGVDVAHLLSHPSSSAPRLSFYAAHGLVVPGPELGPYSESRPQRQVTLMRRGRRIGESIGPTTRWAMTDALRRAGVKVLTEIEYERIEPGIVHVRDAAGASHRIAADTVIVCAGQESERGLVFPLTIQEYPHVVIGGAAQAGELDAERAFRQGAEVPARVAELISG